VGPGGERTKGKRMTDDDQPVDHFPIREFECPAFHTPDGQFPATPYPEEWAHTRLPDLKRLLERIRLACGSQPVRILCGYRTVAYNTELRRRGLQGERHASGVAIHSQHTEGRAADIAVFGMETVQLLKIIMDQRAAGHLPELGGVGYYRSLGFVHVDTYALADGTLRRWNG
jgi:uncharacterized protein YcbK (DUF882 family)